MTIYSVYFVYGVKVTKNMLKSLKERGYIEPNMEELEAMEVMEKELEEMEFEEYMWNVNEEKAKRLDIVQYPHDYHDEKIRPIYLGLVKRVSFGGCGVRNPCHFKTFSLENARKILSEIFPDEQPEYALIPTDCNCCS